MILCVHNGNENHTKRRFIMYKKIINVLILLTGLVKLSHGFDLETLFEGYKYYEITDSAGIPVVKAYSDNGLTFTLPINPESKLTEYVMARLINMHHENNYIGYEPTKKMYLFKYGIKGIHRNNNLKGIGLYEDELSKDIVLEVYLDTLDTSVQAPVIFSLLPGDSAEKKMKFEYLIASIVNYWTYLDVCNDGVNKVFEVPGDPTSKVIGLRFRVKEH